MEIIKKKILEEAEGKIKEILQTLQNDSFGNEGQRKAFVDLLSSLHNSSDKTARKVFKLLGDYCSDMIPTLLEDETEEEVDDTEEPFTPVYVEDKDNKYKYHSKFSRERKIKG